MSGAATPSGFAARYIRHLSDVDAGCIRYSIGVDTTCVRHYTGLNTTLKQRILSGKSWHNIAELVRLDARRQAYVLPMCYLRRYLHIC